MTLNKKYLEFAQQLRESELKFEAFSMMKNDYLYFEIFKYSNLNHQKKTFERHNYVPIVHLNTLAQMLYEAFKENESLDSFLAPVVIVLKKNVVEGIKNEGIYLFNLKNEAFVPIKNIDLSGTMPLLKKSQYNLAVGYVLTLEAIEKYDYKTLNVMFKKESEAMMIKLKKILELHGELECIVETSLDSSDFPSSYIQWIKGK
ncbi:hypothetical protein ACIQYG_22055 [Peribacillus sp. NPDC096622]|uniref:hypothetical protein n=1 Tax=Peribacillus sp. NPDC096622 TaxID=3364396 RepID=UPI0037FC0AF0